MLQEVIDLQTSTVNSLLNITKLKNEVTFKAPTGSGKTYMMANFMNQVLQKEKDVIFIVSSLSKGELAKQNYDKFIEYVDNGSFENLKPYLINSEISGENGLHIPNDYNVYVLPRDLYKDKSKLKQGAFVNFLREVTYKHSLNKRIYVIKDECHIATSNLDALQKDYFAKVINFSATPKKEQKVDVQLNELDAINTHLIKELEYQNENDDLNKALYKFKDIKEKYLSEFGINPCMIIQISNKEQADKEIENIKQVLNNNHNDLKWILIVDDDKKCDTNDVFRVKKLPISKWKEYAKQNSSTIDIIIFKMVITEGWDIPRACMLYQIRDSKSKQLDEQVLGRIRRNPKLLDFEKLSLEQQKLVSIAYVWGMEDKKSNPIQEVKLVDDKKVREEISIKTTRLKKPLEVTTFDIETFLANKKEPTYPKSIFELYDKYKNTTNVVKEMYEEYVDSVPKWFKFMENIGDISKETKNIVCDYETNMEIAKDENGDIKEFSLPLISYFADNQNYKNIGNWLWMRTDNNETFSFDSDAEKEWVEILLELTNEDAPTSGRLIKSVEIKEIVEDEEETTKKYLLAKNYLTNSNIKFEYYLNGIHSSYPDFIMKDYKNDIHIFETKSLNKSSSLDINEDEYEEKIRALKDCYKISSKLTGYYFYIPIKKDSKWIIYLFHNGEENVISKKDFFKFVRNGKL